MSLLDNLLQSNEMTRADVENATLSRLMSAMPPEILGKVVDSYDGVHKVKREVAAVEMKDKFLNGLANGDGDVGQYVSSYLDAMNLASLPYFHYEGRQGDAKPIYYQNMAGDKMPIPTEGGYAEAFSQIPELLERQMVFEDIASNVLNSALGYQEVERGSVLDGMRRDYSSSILVERLSKNIYDAEQATGIDGLGEDFEENAMPLLEGYVTDYNMESDIITNSGFLEQIGSGDATEYRITADSLERHHQALTHAHDSFLAASHAIQAKYGDLDGMIRELEEGQIEDARQGRDVSVTPLVGNIGIKRDDKGQPLPAQLEQGF
jgi:hypothetical protein